MSQRWPGRGMDSAAYLLGSQRARSGTVAGSWVTPTCACPERTSQGAVADQVRDRSKSAWFGSR